MEEKLVKLYNQCIAELKSIDINVDNKQIGDIDIKIAKRNSKRYGCCKQEDPDKKYCKITKKGRKVNIQYEKFNKHHIEICKWVMDLDEKIIKNTIMHELIHCFPNCNNHGKVFKSYANYINEKLGYNITRLGNKKEDFEKSNLEFQENINTYKYKIQCKECGMIFYRKRLKKDFIKKYRCGNCKGKLEVNKN